VAQMIVRWQYFIVFAAHVEEVDGKSPYENSRKFNDFRRQLGAKCIVCVCVCVCDAVVFVVIIFNFTNLNF